MSENVMEVGDGDFEQTVLKNKKPVLVDFWAEWCGPCRSISKALEALAGKNDKVLFTKLNTDHSPETAAKYGIQAIPTIILFKDGAEVNRVVGADMAAINRLAEST